MILTLAGMAAAADRPPEAGDLEGVSPDNDEALEIMKDHMRSQLDWRSYFTDRMDARRRALAAGKALSSQPQAASAE
jgi:hypothetical protein